jgi:hypothetical protein
MVPGLVEDLDDVAIGRGIKELKDIRTGRKGLSAHTGNLDGLVESDNCFVVPIVCLRIG